MINEFKFELSTPLSRKDCKLIEICLEENNVEIDKAILEEYYKIIKPSPINEPEITFVERPNYNKAVSKLQELQFIERFDNEQKSFVKNFYISFVQFLGEEKIPFSKTYETKICYLEKIDSFIEDYFSQYLEETKVWLIRAYLVGRFLIKTETPSLPPIDALKKYNICREARHLANVHKLSLSSIMEIHLALNYCTTTISFLNEKEIELVRKIIIDHLIINKNTPHYKLREIAQDVFDNGEWTFNLGWDSIIRNEYSLIQNRARVDLAEDGCAIYVSTFPNCCEGCWQLKGKVYNKHTAPSLPNSNCSAEICRCILLVFSPDYQFIDQSGKVKLAVEDRKAWRLWYLTNFETIWGFQK